MFLKFGDIKLCIKFFSLYAKLKIKGSLFKYKTSRCVGEKSRIHLGAVQQRYLRFRWEQDEISDTNRHVGGSGQKAEKHS